MNYPGIAFSQWVRNRLSPTIVTLTLEINAFKDNIHVLSYRAKQKIHLDQDKSSHTAIKSDFDTVFSSVNGPKQRRNSKR